MKIFVYSVIPAGLVVGMLLGYSFGRYQAHQMSRAELNSNLYQLWSDLHMAQVDSQQFSDDPKTREEKAYEDNYKINVARASSLWKSIEPNLVEQRFSPSDVQQVTNGMDIVSTNILPPYGMDPTSPTVKRAMTWIAIFENSLRPNQPWPQVDEVDLLKSNIVKVVQKYRSYKSDPNFQIQPSN